MGRWYSLRLRIATWAEVCRHLAARVAASADGQRLALVLPEGPVEIGRVDLLGAPWIALTSAVGPPRRASPVELLVANLHSPIGGFCLIDGNLAIRQTVPLAALRLADLDELVLAVARQAAWAREQLSE